MRYLIAFGLLAAASAPLRASEPEHTVSIISAANLAAPATHGRDALVAALRDVGWNTELVGSADLAHGDAMVQMRLASNAPAESLNIQEITLHAKPTWVLSGGDERGLMYAALEVAERIGSARNRADPFASVHELAEQPFIRDRSLSVYTMNRAHWESRFYDERYWTKYFDLLAADRFNRFLIVFGYENGGFLAPCYPYFFDTPGYGNVHMVGLTPEQQRKNLAALNRLIELAHERGIAVSLGIWDHIYRAGVQTGGAEWVNDYHGKPVPNTVEGVTTENLNAYTLASLQELLKQVPAVDGIQFRIHEESGLKREEMDGFWREVFTKMHALKPALLVEARAKGTPDSVIKTGLDLGLNLRVETKYWMEQMGLPFHPMHTNPPDQHNRRHGYADLLRYPQRYQIDWRLWNGGTSRILLWGDPDYVRRYCDTTLLYQSPNWDVQEPLATKMEAQRPEMPTFDLMPPQHRYYEYEFERYWYFYKVWGRLGYNPRTSDAAWNDDFVRRFGPQAGAHVETALQRASGVLPMIVASVYPYRLFPTTRGWAERQSLGKTLAEYATNETTDIELFESFADAAKRIAAGGKTAKRTPDMTSRWFDARADDILREAAAADAALGAQRTKEFDATMTDVRILAQLARFHARRAIAAVHFNLYGQTKRSAEFHAALEGERSAVAEWRKLVEIAGDQYTFDLAMGARDYDLCGHWRDELAALEADLKQLETQGKTMPASAPGENAWQPAAADPIGPTIAHERVSTAKPGEPLQIVARVTPAAKAGSPVSTSSRSQTGEGRGPALPPGAVTVRVHYRHVTQYEDYSAIELKPTGQNGEYAATIPGDAISADWDFMYYLDAIDGSGAGTMWPDAMRESPYVIVTAR